MQGGRSLDSRGVPWIQEAFLGLEEVSLNRRRLLCRPRRNTLKEARLRLVNDQELAGVP